MIDFFIELLVLAVFAAAIFVLGIFSALIWRIFKAGWDTGMGE